MKKIALLLMCFGFAMATKAQNTALEFDGVDDVAFIEVRKHPVITEWENYTFEAVLKNVPTGRDVTLFHIPQSNGDITFGLTRNNTLFVNAAQTQYLSDGNLEFGEECRHVAFSIFYDEIKFYIDGQFANGLPISNFPQLTNDSSYTLGMTYPNKRTAFQGVVDEIRLWPMARNDGEIDQFAFTTPVYEVPRYLLIPFLEQGGNVAYDAHAAPHNFAYWGNVDGNNMQWVATCMFPNYDLPERIGNGPEPPCITPTNPNELICNGGFEQYHSSLNNPPAWANESDPLFPDPNGVTDVVRWSTTIGTPDFYVRNGIGGIPNSYWTLCAPNTHNTVGTNNAMAALYSENSYVSPNYKEGIETKLLNNLIPGQTYRFQGWFYTGSIWVPNMSISQTLQIRLKSSTSPNVVYNGIPIQNMNSHFAFPSTNGWQFINFIFTLPTPPGYNQLDMLELVAINSNGQSNYMNSGVYTYLDDLSLVPDTLSPPQTNSWPQLINTNDNDPTHRRLHVDVNNNVYVAENINNEVTTTSPLIEFSNPVVANQSVSAPYGFYIAKYDSTGALIWTKMFPWLQIGDFDFDANGDILYTGWYKMGDTLQTTDPGVSPPFTTTVTTWDWGSDNLIIGKLSASTGNQVFLHGYGGQGIEQGVDIVVDNNGTFYIATKVAYNSLNAQPGVIMWGSSSITNDQVIPGTISGTSITQQTPSNVNLGGDLTRIALSGNDVYTMSQTRISRLNKSNLNIYTNHWSLPHPTATGLFADSAGNIYYNIAEDSMSCNTYKLAHNLTVQLDDTLNLVGAKPFTSWQLTQQFPYYNTRSITEVGGEIVIAGMKVYDTTATGARFFIAGVDFVNDTLLWEKTSTNSNTQHSIIGAGVNPERNVLLDIDAMHGSDKIAFVGSFVATGSPWTLSLDNKTLSGSQPALEDDYLFVSTIERSGSNWNFKKGNGDEPAQSVTSLKLYPNPAKRMLTIETAETILSVQLSTITGAALPINLGQASDVATVYLPQLARGMYILRIETNHGIHTEKIYIQQ